MTRSQKRDLTGIIVAAALLAVCMLLPLEGVPRLLAFLVPYFAAGWKTLLAAVKGIFRGQLLDESFLMSLATVGALAIGEYPEAVFVMLFFRVGQLFEDIAVGRSRKSIAQLMDIRPTIANLETPEGVVETDPEEVEVGSVIVVRPGERVPIDGVVVEGASSLDTVALTGESLPRDAAEGDEVISGSVSMTGTLRIRTTKLFGDSTVSRILDLVENSAANKARSESFITRLSHWYTPTVVAGAVLLAIVPSLITGDWPKWIHQALTFLVISCPCALVLSIPLSYFGGIGGASRKGILVKGANFLEDLASTETVLFDKTGTLTRGSFSVTEAVPFGVTAEELMRAAAHAECDSLHPIAASIRQAYGGEIRREAVSGVTEISGLGVTALVEGREIAAGNGRLMESKGIAVPEVSSPGTVVHAAAEGRYLGYIVISDEPKPGAAKTVAELHRRGISTVMLTGDRRSVGDAVAAELGIGEVRSELLPQDKVSIIEEKLALRKGGRVVFVGDGVNDAPVLARADIGVAMGALGSDAAIEAADVVLMDDDPEKLITAIDISRFTNRIVWENIVFALAVKAVALLLGILGMAELWFAIFADVGVLIICVLNAMRALRAR